MLYQLDKIRSFLQRFILIIILPVLMLCSSSFDDFKQIGETAEGYAKYRHKKTNEIYIRFGKSFFKRLGPNKQGYNEYEELNSGIVFVRIPAGTVELREDDGGKQIHEIGPFMVIKSPVTPNQWKKVMDMEAPTGGINGGLLMEFAGKFGADQPWLTIPKRHYLLSRDFGVIAVNHPLPLRPVIELRTASLSSSLETLAIKVLHQEIEGVPSGQIRDVNEMTVLIIEDWVKISLKIEATNTGPDSIFFVPQFMLADSQGNAGPSLKATLSETDDELLEIVKLAAGETSILNVSGAALYDWLKQSRFTHVAIEGRSAALQPLADYWEVYNEGTFRSLEARIISEKWIEVPDSADVKLIKDGEQIQFRISVELTNTSPHPYQLWGPILLQQKNDKESDKSSDYSMMSVESLKQENISDMYIYVENAPPVPISNKEIIIGAGKSTILELTTRKLVQYSEVKHKGPIVLRFLRQGIELPVKSI